MKSKLLSVSIVVTAALAMAYYAFGETGDRRLSNVSEITFTRLSFEENLPEDVLTLRADGTALYEGTKNVERVGSFKGVVPKYGFREFFPLLSAQFAGLRDKPYSTGKPTHNISRVVIHAVQEGKSIEITDWCPGLDERLWAFEMSARGVASDVNWERANK